MKLTEKQEKYIPIKRGIDVVLSGAAIVLLSPVLGGLSLAIKLDSKGPILFKQKRVGKNKELFEIWKFRTMKTDTPKDMPTHLLSDSEQYITRVGKFLRKTSLDELPQLFNIFKGLRPGEKLYEELLVKTEELDKTDNSMIFIERDTALNKEEIYKKIKVLRDACDTGDDLIAKEALRSVVPTFKTPEEVNKEIA